jgi:hypothetical protein
LLKILYTKKNLQEKKDGDMTAPIGIVGDMIEAMIEVAGRILKGGGIRMLGTGTGLIVEEEATNLAEDIIMGMTIEEETTNLAEGITT